MVTKTLVEMVKCYLNDTNICLQTDIHCPMICKLAWERWCILYNRVIRLIWMPTCHYQVQGLKFLKITTSQKFKITFDCVTILMLKN